MADWLIVLIILGGLGAHAWYVKGLFQLYKEQTLHQFKIVYYMLCDNLWPDKKMDKEDNG
tara:strand:+ start:433 stop:612 length:180 start_codon:yes stop_codon:yes gene_type:complete